MFYDLQGGLVGTPYNPSGVFKTATKPVDPTTKCLLCLLVTSMMLLDTYIGRAVSHKRFDAVVKYNSDPG